MVITTKTDRLLVNQYPKRIPNPNNVLHGHHCGEYNHQNSRDRSRSVGSSSEDCNSDERNNKVQLESTLHKNLTRIIKGDADVFTKYEITDQLGSGTMSTVSVVRIKDDKVGGSAFDSMTRGFMGLAIHRKHHVIPLQDRPKPSSEYVFALKEMKVDHMSYVYVEEMYNEIEILRTLDHPNIIKILEVYTGKRNGNSCWKQIYMILEICSGGDLYARSPYSQRDAARIVTKVTGALQYMHLHDIVHRDIKFENIMFENKGHEAEIKIIDFGLSKHFQSNEPDWMTDFVGTTYTMAPQVIKGVYSSQADLWSLGVIAYMLLAAEKPFYAKTNKASMELIMRADVKYDAPIWDTIDASAKDFVQRLLVVDPNERMTATTAMHHEWITNRELMPEEKPSDEILSKIDDCLVRYKYTSDLKKIALNIIAHESSTTEILELRKVFESFDMQGNGVLTFDQFREGLVQCLNYTDSDIEDVFSSIDMDHNGLVMYTQFLAATLEAQGQIQDDKIAEAFDRIDRDTKGYISKKDILEVLGRQCSKKRVVEIMKAADYDNDGKVSYQDFLRHFRETRNQIINDEKKIEDSSLSLSNNTESELLNLDTILCGGRFLDTKCSL